MFIVCCAIEHYFDDDDRLVLAGEKGLILAHVRMLEWFAGTFFEPSSTAWVGLADV